MIYAEKDPTFTALLKQEALKARGLYTGALDNWWGPRSEDAYAVFLAALGPADALPAQATVEGTLANRFRDISADGVTLIKHFEGLYLQAYQDCVGVWTIGWGHTGLNHNDGSVFKGRTITAEQAEALLRYDLDVFEGRVGDLVDIELSDGEFAALVSFDFNTGGLADSTLRRLLNKGDRAGAAEQFGRWVYAGGERLAGLVRRRASERRLFLGLQPYIAAA